MPYIETKTSASVSGDQLTALKEMFAEVIEIIPGKSEEWLMIKVEIFGKAKDEEYDRLTEEICARASKILAVPSDRIYVRYEECFRWGYNGFNF